MVRSEFFFRTTQVRILLFFARIFFPELTLSYVTKTLIQIIFFSSTKIRIFFRKNILTPNVAEKGTTI